MSVSFKEIFDLFPGLGGDTENSVYYIGTTRVKGGVEDNVTLDDSQLSNLVSKRLGLNTNIGSPTNFSISIPDESLRYFIAPIDLQYDAYQVVTDDATPPLATALNWALGSIPASSGSVSVPDLLQYSVQEIKYLWILNGSVVTQVKPSTSEPNSDGQPVPGLIVIATPNKTRFLVISI